VLSVGLVVLQHAENRTGFCKGQASAGWVWSVHRGYRAAVTVV